MVGLKLIRETLKRITKYSSLSVVCLSLVILVLGPALYASTVSADNTNLIANPQVETAAAGNAGSPEDWQVGNWGTNTFTSSYLNSGPSGDTNSVEIDMTSYTSGDAKWYFNPVSITAGDSYTYTDQYQSTSASEVVVAFVMSDGTSEYDTIGTPAASSSWQTFSASFNAPSGAQTATVYHLIQSVGTLTTSNFSLAPEVVPTGNLVPNPLMNAASTTVPGTPEDWSVETWGTNTFTSSYLDSGSSGDSNSVEINMTAYTSGDAKWVFNSVPVQEDTQYEYSDYYKSNVQTQVDAVFTMSDGSSYYEIIGFPGASSNWTQFSSKFSVPLGAQTITIYHLIQSVGTLTIDNASLNTYVPTGFTSPLLTLTFDDGYEDSYLNALPLLQQYGMASTQFVITDLIGQPNYMTATQLKSYYQDGDEIASHTVTHDDLTQETSSEVLNELTASKNALQSDIGAPVTDFAYPYGLYNASVSAAAENYYSSARGVESGLNSKDSFNAYDLKVQDIYDTTTTAQIADWVSQAQATNTWLILVYHDVDANVNDADNGGIYNVTPTQLADQLAAIKSSGIKVETLKSALSSVESQIGGNQRSQHGY